MSATIDHTLIEAAQHIAPVIRAHNEEAERERRLSKPVLDALTQAGLLRMFTPRSLGGLEVDPLTCARVVEEVSAADSVAGWSLFNPLAWAHLCARLPDVGAEEIFGRNPHAVLVGPFHPPMQATPGRWGLSRDGAQSLCQQLPRRHLGRRDRHGYGWRQPSPARERCPRGARGVFPQRGLRNPRY